MTTTLMLANAALLLASAAFGIVALTSPARLAGETAATSPSPAATFYPRMYAARAVPQGVVGGLVVALGASDPRTCFPWLLLAGIIQVLDALIGARQRRLGMVIAPTLAACVHLGTLVWLIVR